MEVPGELLGLDCLHGGDLEQVVSFVHFLVCDLLFKLHLAQGLAQSDHRLQLPDRDRNGVLGEGPVIFGLLPVLDVEALQFFAGRWGQSRHGLVARIVYILFEGFKFDLPLYLGELLALVDVQDMLGNLLIVFVSVDIPDYEDAVEPGQNGRLQFYLLADLQHFVVPTVDRVCCCQHRSPGVQPRSDTGLGYADCLLLHSLMDGHPVGCLHLVKLIDADNAAVSEDQCSALDLELPRGRVLVDAGGETRCRGAFAAGVDGDRSSLLHKLEELGLGSGGVAHQQDVDVTSQDGLVRQVLSAAPEQHAGDCLLDVLVAEDSRRDGLVDFFVQLGVLAELLELFLLLSRVLDMGSILELMNACNVHHSLGQRVKPDIVDHHDASDADPIARHAPVHIVPVRYQIVGPGYLAGWDLLGVFLDLEGLSVDDLALFGEDDEGVGRASLALLASRSADHGDAGELPRCEPEQADGLAFLALDLEL